MIRYSEERKEAVLRKMLPPDNKSIAEISREEGICEATLFNWRKGARTQGRLLPVSDKLSSNCTARNKFAAVLETAAKPPRHTSLDNRFKSAILHSVWPYGWNEERRTGGCNAQLPQ